MTGAEIEQSLRTFFVDTLELNPELLKPEASLKNDIGLTSLDVLDIRLFVERTYGWKMTREDIMCLYTFSDLLSSIESHVG
ncbi:MAG: phosphopantetheine-binding protein [Bacteroidales bacterium]|nr:phosphopantetheine-binding protein [Bacteroidales bacterium]